MKKRESAEHMVVKENTRDEVDGKDKSNRQEMVFRTKEQYLKIFKLAGYIIVKYTEESQGYGSNKALGSYDMFAIQPKFRTKTRADEIHEDDLGTIKEMKEALLKLKIENNILKQKIKWQEIQLKENSNDIHKWKRRDGERKQNIEDLEQNVAQLEELNGDPLKK